MLKHLEIENYILIDHLEIDLYEGFSVITGETGAGKSILLGALELILGIRADTQALLDPEKKCAIEGTFHIKGYGMEPFFRQNELDYDDLLLMRREISPTGKSRAFINDTPVNLLQMKEIGARLVNIHSQNSTTTLNDSEFQLAVLDSYAGNVELTSGFRKIYGEFRQQEKLLENLISQEEKARAEEDYLQFQFEELESAQLREEEQGLLEEELSMLSHAGEIREHLFQASRLLSESESSVLSQLSEVLNQLRRISGYHGTFNELLQRLESGTIELKDIADETAKKAEATEFDPNELERVQSRLDLLYRLQSKHHVQSARELIETRDKISDQLKDISSLEVQIGELRKAVAGKKEELEQLAEKLTRARAAAIPSFEMEITGLLHHMGMPAARFKVESKPLPGIGREGVDHIQFFFSANLGHELKGLSDTASGGELSRVMLAIKSMISQKNLLPTIIFDEIDNGISGDIAGRVGDILLKTASSMQLIAITHLPQIAGKASVQYNVSKKLSDRKTVSVISRLTAEERVTELAKMISGAEITEAARQTARELLNQVSIFDN